MEISVVRQRVRDTIERAKRQTADRRARNDDAMRDYEAFLERIAVPLVRQIANVLKADSYPFTVFTPTGSVKLISDRRAEDYIEIVLDTTGAAPAIVGHTSRARGRHVIETEHPVASGKPGAVTEADLLEFFLKELEPLVER